MTGDTVDVAWLIGVPWKRRRIAGEAASAVCDWLSTRGVRRLTAHIHPDHVASARVARRLAMVATGVLETDGEQIWTGQPSPPRTPGAVSSLARTTHRCSSRWAHSAALSRPPSVQQAPRHAHGGRWCPRCARDGCWPTPAAPTRPCGELTRSWRSVPRSSGTPCRPAKLHRHPAAAATRPPASARLCFGRRGACLRAPGA